MGKFIDFEEFSQDLAGDYVSIKETSARGRPPQDQNKIIGKFINKVRFIREPKSGTQIKARIATAKTLSKMFKNKKITSGVLKQMLQVNHKKGDTRFMTGNNRISGKDSPDHGLPTLNCVMYMIGVGYKPLDAIKSCQRICKKKAGTNAPVCYSAVKRYFSKDGLYPIPKCCNKSGTAKTSLKKNKFYKTISKYNQTKRAKKGSANQ